ncbi:hypothetical protein ACWCQ0_33790 [Streptomyces massasporeus]|uniref:hypothetical protein n=1 Tax=Streptomyces massasporeus TaxID=67324 RepID=UPI0033E20D5F
MSYDVALSLGGAAFAAYIVVDRFGLISMSGRTSIACWILTAAVIPAAIVAVYADARRSASDGASSSP